MEGVGPGTVLGGRYTTGRRMEQRLGTERWSAHDSTLGRAVEILVMPVVDARSPALLDSARQAAAIDSARLVRVLDVGRDGPIAYVVEEDLSDTRSLAELVDGGGLPPDEVRRIAGEVATALDGAAQRGLHHLDLTPDAVLRNPEGEVKLRGLATAGVCAGVDALESEAAARRDAVGVVSLTYAGLTGLWPRLGYSGGLRHAPRIADGVVAPSELASGIPRDLEALCRLTLNDDAGPLSPGDFAAQIAPWPAAQVDHSLGGPADTADLGPLVGPTSSSARLNGAAAPADPTVVIPAVGSTDAAGQLVGSAATTRVGAAAAGATTTLGAGSTALATAVGRASEKVGTLARRAGERTSSLGLGGDDDAPAPLLPSEPLSKDESRLAIGIVIFFVIAALIVGLWGVTRIGSGTNLNLGAGSTGPTPTAHGSGSTTTHSSTSSSATSSPLQKLAILSATGFDPLGDGHENNNLAAHVYDGNPNTEWVSERYNSANLGGLKSGMGVIVDVGPNVAVKQVELLMPVAADVTVYLANDRSLDGAQKVGSKANAQGDLTFDVPPKVSGQYIIVWFTKLTKDSSGGYRAHLAEVIARG